MTTTPPPPQQPTIWRAPTGHLGDTWAHLCRILTSGPEVFIDVTDAAPARRAMIEEIVGLFDAPVAPRYVTREFRPDQRREPPSGVVEMPYPLLKTRQPWAYDPGARYDLCFQFDTSAESLRYNPAKALGEADRAKFAAYFARLTVVEVGLPMTLTRVCETMRQSKAFVGICSGMSIVAHSVGVPPFLKEYDVARKAQPWHYLDIFHANKVFASFADFEEFRMKHDAYGRRLTDDQRRAWPRSNVFRTGFSDRVPFRPAGGERSL